MYSIILKRVIATPGKTCYDHVMMKTNYQHVRTLVLATTLTDHNNVALSISIRYRLNPKKLINRINHTSLSVDLK